MTNKEISSTATGEIVKYYCPVGDESKVSEEQIKNVKELRWNTFVQFKKRTSSVWIVSLPTVCEKWKEGKFTCPYFLKKYVCKHVIGLAIRIKLAKPPAAAKDVPKSYCQI